MPFSPGHLQHLLQQCQSANRLWVAYSGGVDSHVLLHAIHQYRRHLPEVAGAIHVNHGLQQQAAAWADHCQTIAAALHIPFIVEHVTLTTGEGLEDQARCARYAVFERLIEKDDVLLMAHHQDDQAETFLLQAIRGGGPHGLAAMPAVTSMGKGYLVRPLLAITREQIMAYAHDNGLRWIEDPSNLNQRFDRNYLRHTIMPLLCERWPHMSRTLSRSAHHAATLVDLTHDLLDDERAAARGGNDHTLSVAALLQMPTARAALLIRDLCRTLRIPVPATVHIEELIHRQLTTDNERQIRVDWPGGAFRRFQGDLYVLPALPVIPPGDWCYDWDNRQPVNIPELQIEIGCIAASGLGIQGDIFLRGLQIRPRRGGERCKALGDAYTRDLKSVFQYHNVPPWERWRVPLFFSGDTLVAVGDLVVCDHAAAPKDETGYIIRINQYDQVP